MTTDTITTEEHEVQDKDIINGGIMSMEQLLKESDVPIKIYKEGDSVDAIVRKVTKRKIFVTIDNRINGIVGGRELLFDAQVVKGLKEGDAITAYVMYREDDQGNMLLSLRRAGKDTIWHDLAKKQETKEVIAVVVTDANKGGLIIEMGGIKGFLPVSQLAPEHYPRVEGGDKDAILTRLNELVGKPVNVKILSADKVAGKLIFSEREAIGNRDIPQAMKAGDTVEGKVTGIVDFGFFVDVNGIEGLVHISEISWAKVENVADHVKIGDLLKLKIIDIENSRLSLSLKRLHEDPWQQVVGVMKVGDIVKGRVDRITPYGAFVKVKNDRGEVDALVHISEISTKRLQDPSEVLKVGQIDDYKVVSIEPTQHRLSLSLKALQLRKIEDDPDAESEEPKKEDKAKKDKDKKKEDEVKIVDPELEVKTEIKKVKAKPAKKTKVVKAEKKEKPVKAKKQTKKK